MKLTDKKALVTGAARGIGRAIAVAFAADGASVTIAGRTLESLSDTEREIQAAGGRVHRVEWDVTNFGTARQKLAEIQKLK